jgi:hypothetical protein
MHIELLLETLPGADRDQLQALLRAQGFEPLPMKAGLLLSAEREDLQQLLPGLSSTAADTVSIPAALATMVQAIRIFRPRSLHKTP